MFPHAPAEAKHWTPASFLMGLPCSMLHTSQWRCCSCPWAWFRLNTTISLQLQESLWILFIALEHPLNGRSPESQKKAPWQFSEGVTLHLSSEVRVRKGWKVRAAVWVTVRRWLNANLQRLSLGMKCFWSGRDRVKENFRAIWQTNPVTIKPNNFFKTRDYFPYIITYYTFKNSYLSQT